MELNVELWEHQKQAQEAAVNSLTKNGYFWLLAGCATGKTLTMLSVIMKLSIKRVLVITTKSAMNSSWGQDIANHTSGIGCVLLTKGTSTDKGNALYKKYDQPTVFVLNYETASLIWRDIYAANFDMVICDESQRIKSHNSGVSINLAKGCQKIPYRVAMTGTPWDDRPTDVYGQVRWLSPVVRNRGHPASTLLGTWYDFFERYTVFYSIGNGIRVPKSYQRVGELSKLIAPFTLRIDSEEVLDLPKELDITRHITMTPTHMKEYAQLERDLVLGDMTVDNVLTLGLRLQQLSCGMLGDTRQHYYKINETLALLEEIGGKPTVIFTTFEPDVQDLTKALTEHGYYVKLLTGNKHENEEWQAGVGDVLIANMAAGSEGVNLTRARYCIYYSVGFSRTQYNQSRYRVRRPGSDLDHPITYYHLDTVGTIDTSIRVALSEKGDVAQLVYESLAKEHRDVDSKQPASERQDPSPNLLIQ